VTREQRWSRLHHGIDPARVPLLLPWLRLMWLLARPLRLVPPVLITALGVLLALDAVLLAGSVPWAAAIAVLAAALCDGLDGAVAVVADRVTVAGARADAIADRIADAAFAAVLWRCGAPWGIAVGCGALALGVDGLRRARRVPARITVAERPTFTVCAAVAAASAAVTAATWPVVVCAAIWLLAGAIAVGQVVLT
jgi:CDP-diacylglycerol--glycerol-3-phosphate 3-phosphatidyltransferase